MGSEYPSWVPIEEWSVQFLVWGLAFLGMWYLLRGHIQAASFKQMLLLYLPMSVVVGVLEVMIYVLCSPYQLPGHHHTYWVRVEKNLLEGFLTNIVMFWIAFPLYRGIGYYQKFRERERVASQLESQLVNARLQALRMQLNPHFLFNALNGVSSLMRIDVELADEMLERLSSLLRVTLEKGDAQKIHLQEEIEIVQLYVSIQQLRYGDRVKHVFEIEPEVWDVLVPTMILQPVAENAYVHGVSRCLGEAVIEIRACIQEKRLYISIRNICAGFTSPIEGNRRPGLGIANVRARLKLQYGDQQNFSFQEATPGDATALFVLPLEVEVRQEEKTEVSVYANSNTDRG